MENNYINSDNNRSNESYLRAKKKTEYIKKFYKHLIVYVVVNIVISVIKVRSYMSDGDTFEEALFQLDTYIVWLIWGFFLLLRGLRTFKADVFLGSDWEERKIQEMMNDKR